MQWNTVGFAEQLHGLIVNFKLNLWVSKQRSTEDNVNIDFHMVFRAKIAFEKISERLL